MIIVPENAGANVRFTNSGDRPMQTVTRVRPNLSLAHATAIRNAINILREEPLTGGLLTINTALVDIAGQTNP